MPGSSKMLILELSEASLLYARLKTEEDYLSPAERDLLRKIEGYLYAELSIEELQLLNSKEGS
ncbi:hypothetical protein MASR2M78_15960 [Treponema sp.]